MREVSAERFVHATPAELGRALTPRDVVAYEGSFSVRGVEETEEGWVVTAGGGGLTFEIDFEAQEDGFRYEQRNGPLDVLTTTLRWQAENDGSRVQMDSVVSMGIPPRTLTDRVAAWKRRGELRRALDQLAADVA